LIIVVAAESVPGVSGSRFAVDLAGVHHALAEYSRINLVNNAGCGRLTLKLSKACWLARTHGGSLFALRLALGVEQQGRN